MNLLGRFSGQSSCKILYVMTPWSKEIKDFTVSHLQVHPSLYLALAISLSLQEIKSDDRSRSFLAKTVIFQRSCYATKRNSFLEGL